MQYKDKIEREVRKSFEPHPFNAKYSSDEDKTSRRPIIEKVIEKHIAQAIDDYERTKKIGKYKPVRKK